MTCIGCAALRTCTTWSSRTRSLEVRAQRERCSCHTRRLTCALLCAALRAASLRRRAAVTLVEWAERLGSLTPAARLEVCIGDADAAAGATGQDRATVQDWAEAAAIVQARNAESVAAEANDDGAEGDEEHGGDTRPRAVLLQPHGARAAAAVHAVAAFVRRPPAGTPLGGLALLQ